MKEKVKLLLLSMVLISATVFAGDGLQLTGSTENQNCNVDPGKDLQVDPGKDFQVDPGTDLQVDPGKDLQVEDFEFPQLIVFQVDPVTNLTAWNRQKQLLYKQSHFKTFYRPKIFAALTITIIPDIVF